MRNTIERIPNDGMKKTMNDGYFAYLCGEVGGAGEHSLLLEQLHGIEFYSLVPNDHNRGVDGEQLRIKFVDEVGPQGSPSLPDGPCTMLEMLIGLAYRLEFELLGGRYERPMSDWFWVLIDNLGLRNVTDDLYRKGLDIRSKVDIIIRKLLDREYDTDGFGGLFPLNNLAKSGTRDQRRVEVWYQMSAWIIENYPI